MIRKKLRPFVPLIMVYIIFVIYLMVIIFLLIPALNDFLISPRVDEDSYTLNIPTKIDENNITIIINFKTDSPAFWAKEAIQIDVNLNIPPTNLENRYKIRFPYSSLARWNGDRIEYDYNLVPYIELEKTNKPSSYSGAIKIAYHFRGYFDIIVEKWNNNHTFIDSVILEDVIEIRSHTDRDNYNFTRINIALSTILFFISILLFYNQIPGMKKRVLKQETENLPIEISENRVKSDESSENKEKEKKRR